MQALGLYGTLQSNNSKRKGIIMLDGLKNPKQLSNLNPSFLLFLYKLIYIYKHRNS